MKKSLVISFTCNEFDSIDELETSDRELVLSAFDAAKRAYAPYSHYFVGAAARLSDGTIICGTNVENAAFPSGICAERNVIAHAVANFPGNNICTLAIAAIRDGSEADESVSPCGNCRQVISEEEQRTGSSIKLILAGKTRMRVIEKAGSLLPLQFESSSLNLRLP